MVEENQTEDSPRAAAEDIHEIPEKEKEDEPTPKEVPTEETPPSSEEDPPPDGPTLQVSVDEEVEDDDHQAGPTLQFTFQNTDEVDPEVENEKPNKKRSREKEDEEDNLLSTQVFQEETDPQTVADKKIVDETKPETPLEIALTNLLAGKEVHIAKLTNEINKLKGFISKRKQTYKRKRKDEGAPTRALSAYNIFIQDQFEKLAKKNNAALQSTDTNAQLERVPPANLVAHTGGLWKKLPEEEKEKYRERARRDRKRYEEQMAKYQPPDKQANRKRNKTGYNMFFSAHVLKLKQTETGVPSERGSVARLVGTAWKMLSAEEKQYFEREADKHNGANPVDKLGDDDEEDDKDKKASEEASQHVVAQQQQAQQQQHASVVPDHYAAHAAQYAGHDLSAASGYAHAMHQAAQPHDPRAMHHGYYYAQPHAAHPYHYDYSGHHAQQPPPPQGGHRGSRQPYQYGQYYDK